MQTWSQVVLSKSAPLKYFTIVPSVYYGRQEPVYTHTQTAKITHMHLQQVNVLLLMCGQFSFTEGQSSISIGKHNVLD